LAQIDKKFLFPENHGFLEENIPDGLSFHRTKERRDSMKPRNHRVLRAGLSEKRTFNTRKPIKFSELSGLLHIQ
jgi:hypothetical protein